MLPFVEPTNVGPTLKMPDLAPTAVFPLELFRTHADNLRVWQEYNDVDKAIKGVIKTIVTEEYFQTLQNRYTGYVTVCSLDILTHMNANYGMI